MTRDEKQTQALHAYHDGALSRFGKWRIERQLRNSPALREELAELESLSILIREIEEAPASEVDGTNLPPDFWAEIGPALSTIDREVEGASGARRGAAGWQWSWAPVTATAAVAAAVLAMLVVDNSSLIPEHPIASANDRLPGGSLRYLQTNGVSYVVSQDTDDVTIIWLMDSPEVAEGA
ncbi:MAG: hypothetical protein ACI8W3_003822 [Myxococcota bacterium]